MGVVVVVDVDDVVEVDVLSVPPGLVVVELVEVVVLVPAPPRSSPAVVVVLPGLVVVVTGDCVVVVVGAVVVVVGFVVVVVGGAVVVVVVVSIVDP
jgi:hypothetical protein